MKWSGLYTLIALALGIAAGIAINASNSPALGVASEVAQGVGSLWLNALRMTVAPLIVSLLVTGIASAVDAAATGRLAARAIWVFVALVVVATVYVLIVAPVALALFPVAPDAAQAVLAGVAGQPDPGDTPLNLAQWIASLAPSNVIAAAAQDATLPLVLFSVLLGFAATRLGEARRKTILSVFDAFGEAMIVIVRWVLLFAPIGVFGLSLGVGDVAGAASFKVLLHYIVMVAAIIAGVTPIAVVAAIVWGRARPGRFLLAAAPVQALAVSTQSSLACLPAMLQAARERLGVSERTADLALPLAVTLFRMTSTAGNIAVVLFCAHISGVALGPFQLLSGGLVAFAMSVGAVGLPGQTSFFLSIVPIAVAMGVPTELLGILISVEVIPDIFRTVGNVTADMAASVIVDRRKDAAGEAEAGGAEAISSPGASAAS
ncbi:MAG: dicarboxylate/amino acid:cation symporter [Hyphomonadaceae bacterium]